MADILYIAGRVHSISEEGVVTTTDEILDSEQDRKQSVINSEVAQDTQDVANLKNRMTAVEALGEISVGGGDVQIANTAADIEAGSGKVPTVNAIDGALQGIGFFECTTVAGTAAKTISATGYALRSGGSIKVKMTNKNTAASPVTLNINSTGAKALLYKGEPVDSGNTWEAGEVVEIYYDPTYNSNAGGYFANNVAGGSGDGVFDISVYNSGQLYIDLTAALGVNAAHVPANVRAGGMSVKYLGTDNKYHQYRYTLDYEDTQAGIEDFAEAGNWVSMEEELALAGVYDVSAHNDGAYFADLSALLSDANLSTLIPTSVRRGGMSIKFIQGTEQSSDNKYVQLRCMAQNFTTDVTQWQGVTNEVQYGSKDLLESDGAYPLSAKIDIVTETTIYKGKYLNKTGKLLDDSGCYVTDYIPVGEGQSIVWKHYLSGRYGSLAGYLICFDSNKEFIASYGISNSDTRSLTTDTGTAYIRATMSLPNIGNTEIVSGTTSIFKGIFYQKTFREHIIDVEYDIIQLEESSDNHEKQINTLNDKCNLYQEDILLYKTFQNSAGVIVYAPDKFITPKVYITPGSVINWYHYLTNAATWGGRVICYNSNGERVDDFSAIAGSDSRVAITIPENTAYCRAVMYLGSLVSGPTRIIDNSGNILWSGAYYAKNQRQYIEEILSKDNTQDNRLTNLELYSDRFSREVPLFLVSTSKALDAKVGTNISRIKIDGISGGTYQSRLYSYTDENYSQGEVDGTIKYTDTVEETNPNLYYIVRISRKDKADMSQSDSSNFNITTFMQAADYTIMPNGIVKEEVSLKFGNSVNPTSPKVFGLDLSNTCISVDITLKVADTYQYWLQGYNDPVVRSPDTLVYASGWNFYSKKFIFADTSLYYVLNIIRRNSADIQNSDLSNVGVLVERASYDIYAEKKQGNEYENDINKIPEYYFAPYPAMYKFDKFDYGTSPSSDELSIYNAATQLDAAFTLCDGTFLAEQLTLNYSGSDKETINTSVSGLSLNSSLSYAKMVDSHYIVWTIKKISNIYPYLLNKVVAVNNLLKDSITKGDAFIFITDEHWYGGTRKSWNARMSPNLMKYVIDNTSIDKILDGGDREDGYSNAFSRKCFEALGNENYYPAVGNHEFIANHANEDDAYAGSFQHLDNNALVTWGPEGELSYYVDNNNKKIRYIFLQSMVPVPEATGSNPQVKLGYPADTITWLQNIALDVESGWTIVVATHYLANCDDTRKTIAPPPQKNPSVPSIWDSYYDVYTILKEYDGNGTIACVLQGHTHWDTSLIVEGAKNNFPIIVTTCDRLYLGDIGPQEYRVEGTITESAFDVVVLDKVKRKITCVRVGAPAWIDYTQVYDWGMAETRVFSY